MKPVPLSRVLLRLCLCAFCACSLFSAGPGRAETINYPTDGTVLRDPSGSGSFLNSLAPFASSNNSVTVTGGSVAYVFGGYSVNGNVTGNSVSISGGSVGRDVYGGYSSGTCNAAGNSVSISGGSVGTDVLGGYSNGTGDATGNSVSISGGSVSGSVYGGWSGNGNATGNSVTLTGGLVGVNVYGGWSGTGAATNNSVTLTGGTVSSYVYGGYSTAGEVRGNTVSISDGTVDGDVYGGWSGTGNATNNSVSISGGSVGGIVFGGYSRDTGDATGNSVTLTGGSVRVDVYGGWSNVGAATGNSVSISGGSVVGNVYGGRSGTGAATGNSVSISGGTVNRHVYGGWSGGTGDATNNSVSISGGSVGGNVFGGVSATAGQAATNNTVTLAGPANLGASILFGGFVGNPNTLVPAAGDAFTGNTLNVRGFQGTVVGARNFQNYNLALPASYDPSLPLLAITGTEAVNLAGTNVAFEGGMLAGGGGQRLFPGQILVLIDKTQNTPVSLSATGRIIQGVSLEYGYIVSLDSNLRATVTGVGAAPEAKSLSEGRLAGLAFVNQGYDLLLGQGMQSALFASGQQPGGLVPFAAFQGGSSRYDTGSHVDVDGFSLLAGLAWSRDFMPHKITLGAFFEGGWGNYDSHNSFDGFASVAGDGDTSYVGGGVLARWDLTGTAAKGLYVDASFRAGQVKNDFSSDDLRDGFGRKADYDSSSAYYGAHAGLGYIWSITDKASLDFSTRYIWTRQDSDSVTLSTGDPARFEAADSQRWRSGARFSYAVCDYATPYVGAYYDHEFDGKARATTYGHNIDAPDLKGGTGVGELGLTVKPVKDSGFSFDLGVQGYTGVREGVSGSLQLKFEF